jgi:lipoate-protein ligase A
MDEIILKNSSLDEDVIYFYQNHNAIIIGANQNTHVEINEEYVKEHDIKVARRISGGGAVYQDMGNICFSFMTKNTQDSSYENFLEPIFKFLKSLGLNAEFKGRNDVLIDGKKISGNAQYKYKDRMFHHGTLLFNSDLTVLSKALKPNKLKLESKGIKSNRQRVSNILELMDQKMNNQEFLTTLLEFFTKQNMEILPFEKD